MMNKVEITKILVAIEMVIALVIIGLIIYLRDPLSAWCYMAGLSTFALVIINSVVPELRYDEKTEEEEL